ncbi:MAG: putative oxidoreductase [Acidimicrobiaceae bacterium]|nr:MAG: putative oxidoreductase [Acidimicrobiaceae bacterium]
MTHATDHTIEPARLAVEAEQRGFASLFLTEHTHIPVRPFIRWRDGEPMPEEYKRLHDPIVALATAAAVTARIRLGTGILVLAQREPLATAKQLASLDRLSGGRLVLGVGYGWEADELADHGISWDQRRPALREHLTAIFALWRDDEPSHTGERISFGPCWSYPKPHQPSPPVFIGAGGTDSTLLDIVRHADGWMPLEGTEHIDRRWQRLHRLAIDHGRNPAELSLVVYASSGDPRTIDTHHDTGANEVVVGVTGDQNEVLRQLDAHSALTTRFD